MDMVSLHARLRLALRIGFERDHLKRHAEYLRHFLGELAVGTDFITWLVAILAPQPARRATAT